MYNIPQGRISPGIWLYIDTGLASSACDQKLETFLTDHGRTAPEMIFFRYVYVGRQGTVRLGGILLSLVLLSPTNGSFKPPIFFSHDRPVLG